MYSQWHLQDYNKVAMMQVFRLQTMATTQSCVGRCLMLNKGCGKRRQEGADITDHTQSHPKFGFIFLGEIWFLISLILFIFSYFTLSPFSYKCSRLYSKYYAALHGNEWKVWNVTVQIQNLQCTWTSATGWSEGSFWPFTTPKENFTHTFSIKNTHFHSCFFH